jgi:hypothetical protein
MCACMGASTQPPVAFHVRTLCHCCVQVPLLLAPPLETLAPPGGALQLGLAGAHQRLNAAMAVQLCRLWAKHARPDCPTTLAHEQVRSVRVRHASRRLIERTVLLADAGQG